MEYTVTMRMTFEQLEALRNAFESGQVGYEEFSYEEFFDDGESIGEEDSEAEEDSEDEEPNTSDDEFIDDSDI